MPRPFLEANIVFGSTPLHSINAQGEPTRDFQILWTVLVSRKLVCNWPVRKKVDPWEFGVIFAILPQTGKLPKRLNRRNTTARQKVRASAVYFKKRRNIPNGSVPPQESRSNRSGFTSRDQKAKVVRLEDGSQVNGRSTGSQDCFPSRQVDSISLPSRPTHRPDLRLPNERRKR